MRRLSLGLMGVVGIGCGDSGPAAGDSDTDAAEPALSVFAGRAEAGALRAGAAVRSIVPRCFEDWVDDNRNFTYRLSENDTFRDCGCDKRCPGDPGYTAPDEGEGDGVFQAVWMGGFQNGKPATAARGADRGLVGEGDGLDARAIVIERGDLRLGIVALDALGFMYDDALDIRALAAERGLDIDHIIVHSSHTHSAPDSMGIYGPNLSTTGYDPAYADQVHTASVDALAEALAGLEPVTLRYGVASADTYWDNGSANLIRDSRDPWIVDPRVGAIQFVGAASTVATVVHWANHPETVGGSNTLLTSGFVHALRRGVSEGTEGRWQTAAGKPGLGGTTLFLNGTVGGMMTSLGAQVEDPDGVVHGDEPTDDLWVKTDVIGLLVAEMALDAIAQGDTAAEADLVVGAQTVKLPVDNTAFQAMFRLGNLAHRTAYGVVDDAEDAEIDSEMDIVQLGPLRMVTWPGEVLPEVVLGGKDGAYTAAGVPIVDPANEFAPDVSTMPDGPYLLDTLGGELSWILGLGNDEIGYIIPEWQFVLGPVPYLQQAPGDHYEETNSLGPLTVGVLEQTHRDLVRWLDDAR